MTYRGIVSNGVVVLEGEKPAEGTIVDVTPRALSHARDLDISYRLAELRELKDGWLDGKGKAPASEGLDWLSSAFATRYPRGSILPYLYPTAEGDVLAEWTLGDWEASLEIDLASHSAEWHALDVQSGREASRKLDLDSDDAWRWLGTEIRRLAEGGA